MWPHCLGNKRKYSWLEVRKQNCIGSSRRFLSTSKSFLTIFSSSSLSLNSSCVSWSQRYQRESVLLSQQLVLNETTKCCCHSNWYGMLLLLLLSRQLVWNVIANVDVTATSVKMYLNNVAVTATNAKCILSMLLSRQLMLNVSSECCCHSN